VTKFWGEKLLISAACYLLIVCGTWQDVLPFIPNAGNPPLILLISPAIFYFLYSKTQLLDFLFGGAI
jgi:hypothetical protein